MWQRYELKDRAKFAFKKNYGQSVFAGLVLAFVSGALLHTVSGFRSNSALEDRHLSVSYYADMIERFSKYLPVIIMVVVSVLFVILLIRTLILNPLSVGAYRFFMLNADREPSLHELLFAFESNYFNIMKTMFIADVIKFLYFLLLLIPGIIKSYSFRMVPYLLAEQPDMDTSSVLQLSESMMNGEKLDTFVLDLSFFGWWLFAMITLGFAGIFYVFPYIYATDAELYLVLKQNSILEAKETDEYI